MNAGFDVGTIMRTAVMAVCFTLFMANNADAQLLRKTYFLIDVSGSMKGKLEQAEQRVSEEIKKLATNAPVSRTYFGGNNGGACWSEIKIGRVQPASTSAAERPALLNDSTQLGTALKAALDNAGSGPATIFLLSDQEQTENCGVDVCAVADEYLPRRGIRVVSVPVGSTSANKDRLGCIDGAQFSPDRLQSIRSITLDPNQSSNGNAGSDTNIWWIVPLLWASFFSIFAFLTWLLIVVGRNSTMLARRMEALATIESGQEAEMPNHKWPLPLQVSLAFLPLLVPAFTIIALSSTPKAPEQAWNAAWPFANANIVSQSFPIMAGGYVGWILIELWKYFAFRREKLTKARQVQLAKIAADARVREVQAREKILLDRQAEERVTRLRERAEILASITKHRNEARAKDLEQVEAVRIDPEDQSLKNTYEKMRSISDALEEIIASISANEKLKGYDRPRSDYVPIIEMLRNQGVLPKGLSAEPLRIFRAWNATKGNGYRLDQLTKKLIDEFDLERLQILTGAS